MKVSIISRLRLWPLTTREFLIVILTYMDCKDPSSFTFKRSWMPSSTYRKPEPSLIWLRWKPLYSCSRFPDQLMKAIRLLMSAWNTSRVWRSCHQTI
jgi:hypothetical protein